MIGSHTNIKDPCSAIFDSSTSLAYLKKVDSTGFDRTHGSRGLGTHRFFAFSVLMRPPNRVIASAGITLEERTLLDVLLPSHGGGGAAVPWERWGGRGLADG
jgi:hypothetical protein